MRYVISMSLVATKTVCLLHILSCQHYVSAQQCSLRRKPSDPACVVAFVPPDLTHGTSDGPRRLITLGHEDSGPSSERDSEALRRLSRRRPASHSLRLGLHPVHPRFQNTQGPRLYLDRKADYQYINADSKECIYQFRGLGWPNKSSRN